jgi:hypothetical protein
LLVHKEVEEALHSKNVTIPAGKKNRGLKKLTSENNIAQQKLMHNHERRDKTTAELAEEL